MKIGPTRVRAIALGALLALTACATPHDVRTASKDLSDRTDSVRSDLESKQAELRRELKETRELAAGLKGLLREVKDQDLSGLQGRLERQEKEIRDLQGRLENQSAQMSGMVDTVDQKLLRKVDDQAGRVVEIQGHVKKIEADAKATPARLAEVEKNIARVTDTMKEVATKLSTQTQQQSGKLDETSKHLDQQVRSLSAQVNQFQGTLAEFSKVLHAMAAQSTQADRRVTELSGNTEGKVGLLVVQQSEQSAKIEQLTKRVEVEGQAVTKHLNDVTRNVSTLAKSLDAMQTTSGELSTRVSQQGQQGARLEVLAKTLDATVATMNDTTRAVGDLKQVIETSIEKLATRVTEQGDALNQLTQRPQAGGGEANGSAGPASGSGGMASGSGAAPPVAKIMPSPPERAPERISDKEAYDQAYLHFIQGRYNPAIVALGGFLTRYPDSPLVPNAHFWIAESYFRTQDYARGIEFYDHVITRHPKSGKASTALYRKALALLELKDKAAAKNTLRQLISNYPKSDDSIRAQAKLSSLR